MKKIFVYILSVLLIFCFCLNISAENDDNANETAVELGADEAFLHDKQRQLEWERQVWEKVGSIEPEGDFKTGSRSVGTWSWRDGVICITDSYASVEWFNNGHAGIIGVAPYYYGMVEANPGSGVEMCYGTWTDNYGSGKVVQVGVTDTTVEQDHLAAEWATNQIGKPYKFPTTLNNRNEFYCSHLVYAAYLDTCNVNLDTIAWPGFIHPFEILNNSLVTVIFNNEK